MQVHDKFAVNVQARCIGAILKYQIYQQSQLNLEEEK